MQSTIYTLRAIGAEFIRRQLRPFIIIGTIFVIILLTLGGWLTTQNAWWWILEALIILWSLLFLALTIAVCIVVRVLAPPLSKKQKRDVAQYVDKLERVAETIQTPQLAIIFYVVRDTIRPTKQSFIETISTDSKALAPDFIKLRKDFTQGSKD